MKLIELTNTVQTGDYIGFILAIFLTVSSILAIIWYIKNK